MHMPEADARLAIYDEGGQAVRAVFAQALVEVPAQDLVDRAVLAPIWVTIGGG